MQSLYWALVSGELVDSEQSLGPVTNCRARKNLRPRPGERFEGSTRLLLAGSPEGPVAPRRASAETHSVRVAHHVIIAGSALASRRVLGWP